MIKSRLHEEEHCATIFSETSSCLAYSNGIADSGDVRILDDDDDVNDNDNDDDDVSAAVTETTADHW